MLGARVTMLGCYVSVARAPQAPRFGEWFAPPHNFWQLPPVLAPAPARLPTRATSSPLLHKFGGPVRRLDGGIELAALLCQLVHLPSQGGDIDGRHPPDLRARIPIDP